MVRLQGDNRLYWWVDGKSGTPMRKLFVSEAKQGMTTPTIWDNAGLNQHASRDLSLVSRSCRVFSRSVIRNHLGASYTPGGISIFIISEVFRFVNRVLRISFIARGGC